MAADLEKLAKYFQSKGFLALGNIVFDTAALAREIGAPEYLEQNTLQEQSNSRVDFLIKLAEAMIIPPDDRGYIEEGLTFDIARKINRNAGHSLPNSFPITDLRFPSISEAALIDPVFEQYASRVDPWMKGQYNSSLSPLYGKYSTVGDLRNTSVWELVKLDQIGPIKANFVKLSFDQIAPVEASLINL